MSSERRENRSHSHQPPQDAGPLRQPRHVLQRPLSDWAADRQLTPNEILERVCADILHVPAADPLPPLMQYLHVFPVLRQDPEALLDVVDAHVCALRSRNEPVDASLYTALAPELKLQIERLLDVDAIESVYSRADDFSLDESESRSSATTPGCGLAEPLSWTRYCSVDLPDDIRPSGLISLRQDVTCLRGLADDQTPVLIKVVNKRRLCDADGSVVGGTVMTGSDHAGRIGDRLETLSRWQHPAWIRPLALVESDTQIVMIRPWIGGTLWTDRFVDNRDRPDRQGGFESSVPSAAMLRGMAEVGYAVAALHQQGLAHGALHPRNLLRDHDGGLKIVDAGFGFPDPATQWDWHLPPAADPAAVQKEETPHETGQQEQARRSREQARDITALLRLTSECLVRVRLAFGPAPSNVPQADAVQALWQWCQRQRQQCLVALDAANRTDSREKHPPRQPSIGAADIADHVLALADGRPLQLPGEPESSLASERAVLPQWLRRWWGADG